MKGEAINKLVELIRIGMKLDQAHVVTYNQMIPIPKDEGIFVAVGSLDAKPYAASLGYKDTGAGLNEVQSVNVREVFSIHLMSKDNSSRARRQDLIFALTGTLAAQFQEKDGFAIAKIPIGFVDSSITEGAERLNRYTITIVALYAKAREGSVDFFDSYSNSPELITES